MTARTRLDTSGLGDEAQDGEADEKRVEGFVLRPAEHGIERCALEFGELLQAVDERQHHLMHAGVIEGHLRFDAGDADDTEVGRCVDRVLEQRGLPDARRAGEQQRTGDAAFGVAEECVDRGALGGAADLLALATNAPAGDEPGSMVNG